MFIASSQTACPIAQAVSFLLAQTASRPLVLAFSGGMDSTVLLNALAKQQAKMTVVHVHHGLQASADAWLVHCQDQAALRAVPFCAMRVQVADMSRRGLEDRAREARYAALWQQVDAGGVLLTAHHQRDQAETFLLRALRGAGVSGLGAIKAWQQRDNDRILARPLLSVSYQSMQTYAHREGLLWVDDPTNQDDFALRNAIRRDVLPVMRQLQPQVEVQLARAASHAQEAQVLLQMMAREDWQKCQLSQTTWHLPAWRALPWLRAKNALMFIWQERTATRLSLAQWQQIEQQFYQHGRDDAHPRFCWHGWCLLIDGGKGYWLPETAFVPPHALMNWSLSEQVSQSWGALGRLSVDQDQHHCVTIRSRIGGEVVKTAQGSKTLKKWLQAQQIPAWQKAHWPVVYDAQSNQLLGWANMPDDWWQDEALSIKLV